MNLAEITQLRQPIDSKAFPSLEKHFQKAANWKSNIIITTNLNSQSHKLKRQYFDTTAGIKFASPEAYIDITPVRSQVQQSQLIKAFLQVKREEDEIRRPKSRSKSDYNSLSNDYGIIPSLRPEIKLKNR